MTMRLPEREPADARLAMCGMDPHQRHQPSPLEQLRADDARAERAIAAGPLPQRHDDPSAEPTAAPTDRSAP